MHLKVEGRVQGVCYRMCARDEALRLGLSGWIRNAADGSVESLAEGEERDLAEFLDWCRKGPPYARVIKVGSHSSDYQGSLDGFEIRY